MTAMTIYNVSDRETISSLTTAVGFTAAKLIAYLVYAVIQAIGGDVRFCIDGDTPVADATGFRLLQDASAEVWGTKAMHDFLCIDDGGTAKLEVVYMTRA